MNLLGATKGDMATLQNGAGIGGALGAGVAAAASGIQLASLPPQHQQVIIKYFLRVEGMQIYNLNTFFVVKKDFV